MTKRLAAAVVLSGLTGLACSGLTPVEITEENADYVGAWAGKDTTLVIEQAGTAAWVTKSGGASTSLNGNITFTDDGFSIGFPPMAMNFTATDPTLNGSLWEMTVNDIELQRAAAPGEGGGKADSGGGRADGGGGDEATDGGDEAPPARGGGRGGGGRGGRR